MMDHTLDEPAEAGLQTALKALLGTVSHKVDRRDCPAQQAAGIQIGSCAVESLRRIATQIPCRIHGGRCLPDSAVTTTRMRLLTLVRRSDDFRRSTRLTSLRFQGSSL